MNEIIIPKELVETKNRKTTPEMYKHMYTLRETDPSTGKPKHTYEEIAAMVGVSRPAVTYWLNPDVRKRWKDYNREKQREYRELAKARKAHEEMKKEMRQPMVVMHPAETTTGYLCNSCFKRFRVPIAEEIKECPRCSSTEIYSNEEMDGPFPQDEVRNLPKKGIWDRVTGFFKR